MKIDREKLKELINKGLRDREIAKILGCKSQTISQIRVNEFGILRGKRNELEGKIIEAWKNGIRRPSEIAYHVGAHPCYVSYTLLKHKLRKPLKQQTTYTRFFEIILESPKTSDDLSKLGISKMSQRSFYMTLRKKSYPIEQLVINKKRVYFVKGQEEKAREKASKFAEDSQDIVFLNKMAKSATNHKLLREAT